MRTLIFAICVLIPSLALAQQELSADYLDMDGVSLADTPETEAVPMAAHGQMTQLTLRYTITWGTSTKMTVKCKTSASEASGYTWVDACQYDGTYHQCKPLVWRWDSTNSPDGLATLELRSNARYVICVSDDPDDGTGTVVVTGTRGRP
jgi:hypothetical protein